MTTPRIEDMVEEVARKMGFRTEVSFHTETIRQALTQAHQDLLHDLTEGVMIGSDGQRNCYFIPCERIDDTIKALQDNK